MYHTLNLRAASYIRKVFSIPLFLYIDDRLIEEIRNSMLVGERAAEFANYIACKVLLRLGYFLNLK